MKIEKTMTIRISDEIPDNEFLKMRSDEEIIKNISDLLMEGLSENGIAEVLEIK